MAILDELKLKANGAADQANNIQEAISAMEFGGGGSGGGVFFVRGARVDESGNLIGILDKTWQEIHDAMQNQICIVIVADGDTCLHARIMGAREEDSSYSVFFSLTSVPPFITSSKNGYPANDML